MELLLEDCETPAIVTTRVVMKHRKTQANIKRKAYIKSIGITLILWMESKLYIYLYRLYIWMHISIV